MHLAQQLRPGRPVHAGLAVAMAAVIALAASASPAATRADTGGTNTIKVLDAPTYNPAATGGTFTVHVVANGSVDISGAGTGLAFDKSKLTLTAIAKDATELLNGASYLGFPSNANTATFLANANTNGQIPNISWTYLDGVSFEAANADHGIYAATFTVTALGDTALTPSASPTILNGATPYGTALSVTTVAGNVVNPAPSGTVPDAPTGVQVTPTGSSAAVSWTLPVSDGGQPITGYTASATPGGKFCSSTGTTGCTITGMADGYPYTVSVVAKNVLGPSAASAASAAFRIDATAPSGGTVTLGACSGTGVACSGTTVFIGSPAVTNGSTFQVTYTSIAESGSGIASVSCAAAGGFTATPGGTGTTRTCTYLRNAAGLDAGGSKATTATDAAGNTGALGAFSVVRDTTAPTAVAPKMSLRTGVAVSGSSVPVTVSWPATVEGGSGLGRYELGLSTNGGSTWTTTVTSATSAALLAPGAGSVMWRLRAIDKAGNASAYSALTEQARVHGQQWLDALPAGWTVSSGASYAGGSTILSSTAGTSATYRFTGRSVGLVTTLGPTHGVINVYVDGSLTPVAVNTYNAIVAYQRLAWQQTWATTGAHTVRFVVVGTAGHPTVDIDAVAGVYTDAAAPTVTAPVATIPASGAASGSTFPVRLTWTATDNAGGSGIARSELGRSTDAGATWTAAWSGAAVTATVAATASGTVAYRVRAYDKAVNASAYGTGAAVTPVLAQTVTGVTYTGAWATETAAGYSGGSTRYSSAAGASATYTFSGRSIALVMTKAATRGSFKVAVDGSSTFTTISTTASATTNQALVWSSNWSASGAHTVKIVVVSGRVDLDAFALLQ